MGRSTASGKLAKYRAMRDFAVTAEPPGERVPARPGDRFVVQKHAARGLHYDVRLELDGVLLSWAVPKGPSLAPAERRLAVRTEDHPVDYADFEGVIPAGQYGGGAVVVWDRGRWIPEGDPHAGLAKGRLTFVLEGEKLHGRWHLIRTRGADQDGQQDTWLLFKSRDEAASDDHDIVAERPESVLSGKTIEDIADAPAPPVAPPPTARPAASQAEVLALVAQLPLGFPLTSLDRVIYPDQGTTKGELIAYFAVIADWILPHVTHRPLTLVRCPEGRGKPCFFQKHALAGAPPAIHHLPITEESGEVVDYMEIRDLPGLVALAQLGTLEIHTWGARADRPERPDLAVFDLDPDVGLGWEPVALGAFELRRRLSELGLQSWVKTTGGKGLHVVAPIDRRLGWYDFKEFTRLVVEQMEQAEPARYTTTLAKSARKGKIFLDYLRNGRNATFIAPYSPRARAGAPVAVPITWEELAHGVDAARFTIHSVPRRLANLPRDPWEGIHGTRQAITTKTWRALGRRGSK